MSETDVSTADAAPAPDDTVAQGADGAVAAATAAPDAKADATILSDAGGEAGTDEPEGDWRPDWREKLAAGDEKELKRLQRLQSPLDLHKAYRELEKKLSSGKVREALPENATDEQVAAYRKANGIPDAPEGYLAKLPEGLVIGADDKPLVQDFLASVHAKNADPAFVGEALAWWNGVNEKAAAERAAIDKQAAANAADELRAEWGQEYRANFNAANNFLSSAPDLPDGTTFAQMIETVRLPDGSRLGNNATFVKWLARLAADANPAGFIAPQGGGSQLQSVQDERAEIEKLMRTDPRSYYKDARKQERYRQLLEAEEKLSARG